VPGIAENASGRIVRKDMDLLLRRRGSTEKRAGPASCYRLHLGALRESEALLGADDSVGGITAVSGLEPRLLISGSYQ